MSFRIYSLTPTGEALSHTTNAPKNVNWRVIYHLKLVGQATKEQLREACGATSADIMRLMSKGIIADVTQVRA